MKYLLLVILISMPLSAQAPDALVLDAARDTYLPGNRLEILEDRGKSLTIRDVAGPEYASRFKRLRGVDPDFGFTSSVFWARIAIGIRSGDWIMEVHNPWLSRVSLFLPRRDGSFSVSESGAGLPYSSRVLQSRNIAFPLGASFIEPKYCYLRVESDLYKALFPISILKTETFWRINATERLIFGIYLGIIAAMFFYNLFIYFSLRDKSYLFYVLAILCFVIFQTIISGYAQDFLWRESPAWNRVAFIMPCCGIILGSPFVGRYLKLRINAPRLGTALRWVSRLGWPLMVVGLLVFLRVIPSFVQIALLSLAYFLLGATIMLAGAVCAMKRYSPAIYGFLAFTGYLGGLVIFPFMASGVILGQYHSRIYIQQITTAAGLLLLSLGLADRINVMRREQEQARTDSLETELRYRDARIQSQRMELELLKKTIQPHFVMNTLTAVRSWLLERPEKAVRLIDALADELRPVISHSSMKLIPLRDEINLCRSHLEVMGLRLDRDYTLDVTGTTGNETVPPLIFHTMMENAFTHGDPYRFSRFSIEKVPLAGGCRYIFSIDSDASGTEDAAEGTGTRYIRSRLEESYPHCWDLACGQSGGLWTMTIEIREAAR